jgi:hypothetical protein
LKHSIIKIKKEVVMPIGRRFDVKWDDLTQEAKKEYLAFFGVKCPIEDAQGNLITEKK